jgi:hypothetical protein
MHLLMPKLMMATSRPSRRLINAGVGTVEVMSKTRRAEAEEIALTSGFRA